MAKKLTLLLLLVIVIIPVGLLTIDCFASNNQLSTNVIISRLHKRPRDIGQTADASVVCTYYAGTLQIEFLENEGDATLVVDKDGVVVVDEIFSTSVPHSVYIGTSSGLYTIEIETDNALYTGEYSQF